MMGKDNKHAMVENHSVGLWSFFPNMLCSTYVLGKKDFQFRNLSYFVIDLKCDLFKLFFYYF